MASFEAIPHDRLMQAVEVRISDRHVRKLLRALLRAGVMQDGSVRRPASCTPQGGCISPLHCNVHMTRLDRAWRPAYGTLVRYADDRLATCRTKGQVQAALAWLTVLLAEIGLQPKAAKTTIAQLVEGQPGV